jgi:serine/threonine protein kinase
MEAAFGGEIFDFVATGRLLENVTRLYFKKLMTAIKLMHANGVYHRDLKPENLLLNE